MKNASHCLGADNERVRINLTTRMVLQMFLLLNVTVWDHPLTRHLWSLDVNSCIFHVVSFIVFHFPLVPDKNFLTGNNYEYVCCWKNKYKKPAWRFDFKLLDRGKL